MYVFVHIQNISWAVVVMSKYCDHQSSMRIVPRTSLSRLLPQQAYNSFLTNPNITEFRKMKYVVQLLVAARPDNA